MNRVPGGEAGMRDAMLRHQPYEYEQLEEIREAARRFYHIYCDYMMENHLQETPELSKARTKLDVAFTRRVAYRDA